MCRTSCWSAAPPSGSLRTMCCRPAAPCCARRAFWDWTAPRAWLCCWSAFPSSSRSSSTTRGWVQIACLFPFSLFRFFSVSLVLGKLNFHQSLYESWLLQIPQLQPCLCIYPELPVCIHRQGWKMSICSSWPCFARWVHLKPIHISIPIPKL